MPIDVKTSEVLMAILKAQVALSSAISVMAKEKPDFEAVEAARVAISIALDKFSEAIK